MQKIIKRKKTQGASSLSKAKQIAEELITQYIKLNGQKKLLAEDEKQMKSSVNDFMIKYNEVLMTDDNENLCFFAPNGKIVEITATQTVLNEEKMTSMLSPSVLKKCQTVVYDAAKVAALIENGTIERPIANQILLQKPKASYYRVYPS